MAAQNLRPEVPGKHHIHIGADTMAAVEIQGKIAVGAQVSVIFTVLVISFQGIGFVPLGTHKGIGQGAGEIIAVPFG